MKFLAANLELFTSRNDPTDPRWGDQLSSLSLETAEWVLKGYPDEEGIRLNGGRLGAAQAPDSIRRQLFKTTFWSKSPTLLDLGNLEIAGNLDQRHQFCRSSLTEILKLGKRAITLGGGHDFGYPDGAAFLEVFKDQSPLVLNFDAHLDVRNLDRGLSSGTPFFRLIEEFKKFEFHEIGLQPQCNSEAHWNWLLSKDGQILSLPEIRKSSDPLCKQITDKLALPRTARRPTYLSIDIDAFCNAEAPGCSQSWVSGLTANEFLPVLHQLTEHLDLRVVGIYEVSPPFDVDHRTSKLAAQIIHSILTPAIGHRAL
ncbi:MAG: formimidoylglutamase [Bdellovibrionales bacterium]|nr:formimidoylglutamase [Bdellovibrionales bacterium]